MAAAKCCCVMPTIRRTPHRCSIRAASATPVQFTVGQTVNFEPTGADQGWQLKDNQGRPLEYLPEATGPRDIFDTRR